MYHCSFTPYEGDNDYIFVSYAHADAEAVLPILDDLSERGYRVWYDEGIAPGSEWPEFIARHLNGSAIVMYFVSEASVASDNCRREVTFALSKQKGLLAVMLEPVKLPLGLEMQLAAQRCVLRYKYPSEEKFMANVCSMPELMSCRKRQGGRHAAPAASSAAKTNAQSSRHQRERNYAQPKAQSSSKGVVIALLAGLALLSLLGGMLVYALTGQSNNVIETPPPVQTPLQTATPTPTLQPAPTPTPAVALTPAPVPVQTPQPTVMPVPTYDPYADQTPFPTAAPIPSFTPEITPMPTPEPTASVDIYVPEMPIETYDPYFPPESQPDHPTVPEAEIILPGSQEPEGNMQSMEGNFAIA